MEEEIRAAVVFLVSLVTRRSDLAQDKVKEFGERLTTVLRQKYQGHWYPTNPSKGQAYRCIRINKKQQTDPSLLLACEGCGLEYNQLRLPKEITLWIDPSEVCCRSGESCQPFTVAQFKQESRRVSSLDSEHEAGSSECNTSDYHTDTSSDEEERTKEQPINTTAGETAEAATKQLKVAGGSVLSQSTVLMRGAWRFIPACCSVAQYPHKLVQYATFYQPVPLVSYYLMPRLDKVLRPPPGFLLSRGRTQRSKIGKRYK